MEIISISINYDKYYCMSEVFKTESGSLCGWRLLLRAKTARWAVNLIEQESKSPLPFQSHSEGFEMEIGDGVGVGPKLENGFSHIHSTVHSARTQ